MNNVAVAVALSLGLVGCACLYLASPHQRWRTSPLPARPACAAGSVALLGSVFAFARAMAVAPAVFAFVAWVMLLLVVFPYVGAAFVIARRRR